MDDIGHSTATAEAAFKAIDEVNTVLARGKFETKTWNSNHLEVDGNPEEPVIDVLGHRWNKEADVFAIKSRDLQLESGPTMKRSILSLVVKILDPLGILAPASINFRINLQDLWRRGVAWDQPLGDEDDAIWHEHLTEMQELVQFRVPRCLKPDDAVSQPQLHCFSDGGSVAYGAAFWLRWTHIDGKTTMTFVMTKALVASLKKNSIPRLELMAAVFMSRVAKFIQDSMGGVRRVYVLLDRFSDSTDVDSICISKLQAVCVCTHPRDPRYTSTFHG